MLTANRLPALSAFVAGLSLACASAWAGEVRDVSVQAGATGTRAEIQLAGGGSYKTLSLSAPNRLVVDFPDSSAVRGLKLPAAAGVVTAVRSGQPVPGTFRVVFDLAESVVAFKPQMQVQGAESKLSIEWPGEGARPVTATVAAAPATSQTATPAASDARADAARATAALTAAVAQQANAPAPVATPPVQQEARPSPAAILNGQGTPPATPVIAGNAPATPPVAVAVAAAKAPVVEAEPATPRPAMPSDASRIRMQPGMRTLVVAIDPGHGGQDPGALGPTGKREKDVTLAVARELARQVNATPGLRAFLTRDTDVFIPLPMRAQRARAAKADIFISIHADAAENRSATGSSVYVLSTKGASSQRARWLADKENAADLIGGVNFNTKDPMLARTLLDLSQTATINDSLKLGKAVLGELDRVGDLHKAHVEQAGFAVLKAPDIPSILVETAFISNPAEERRLNDDAYQDKLAEAIMSGIRKYFRMNPPLAKSKLARLD